MYSRENVTGHLKDIQHSQITQQVDEGQVYNLQQAPPIPCAGFCPSAQMFPNKIGQPTCKSAHSALASSKRPNRLSNQKRSFPRTPSTLVAERSTMRETPFQKSRHWRYLGAMLKSERIFSTGKCNWGSRQCQASHSLRNPPSAQILPTAAPTLPNPIQARFLTTEAFGAT